jgi:NADH-quinone oxidoreductase subunit J
VIAQVLQQIVFFVFAGLLIGASTMVILSRNTVRGALFLVLAFFASSVLWMLLQAEFLSLVLIFVYVGAVMTLFLFVVMMINVDLAPIQEGFVRYLPFGFLVIVLLVALMMFVIGPEHFRLAQNLAPMHSATYSNINQLGAVLYTDYVFQFEIAAVILLVAIIAAVSLTHRRHYRSKAQKVAQQVSVRPEDRMRIVKMPSEKRVDQR